VQNLPQQIRGQWGFINEVLLKLFGNVNFLLLFIAPVLTMSSFAKEKADETLNLYFASPCRDWDIVLGKFISIMVYFSFLIATTLIFVFILNMTGLTEFSIVWSGYLGLFLNLFCYVSLGLYVSSCTQNQVIAAMGTFVGILGIWFLSWGSQITNNYIIMQILKYLSIVSHFEQIAKGVLPLASLCFYMSFTFIFLYLTKKVLESRNW
jgi:ABC-2 type transport system permease protein